MSDEEDQDSERDYHETLAQFMATFEHDEYELLPSLGDPGPQTQTHRDGQRLGRVISRALLDDEDSCVIEYPFPDAGKVLCRQDANTPSKDSDGDTVMEGDAVEGNSYAPFASELDWQVAQWAVKETVAQSAFDRLLNIPGVRPLSILPSLSNFIHQVVEKLGLSFDNVRRLHQVVDALPDKAGEWTTSQLSFHDDPSMTFTVRHRDVLKAIESIFKNPELAPHLVYKPSKVYSSRSKDNRIFSEMWTASGGMFCRYVKWLNNLPSFAFSGIPTRLNFLHMRLLLLSSSLQTRPSSLNSLVENLLIPYISPSATYLNLCGANPQPTPLSSLPIYLWTRWIAQECQRRNTAPRCTGYSMSL
jgi:hypothetical protein